MVLNSETVQQVSNILSMFLQSHVVTVEIGSGKLSKLLDMELGTWERIKAMQYLGGTAKITMYQAILMMEIFEVNDFTDYCPLVADIDVIEERKRESWFRSHRLVSKYCGTELYRDLDSDEIIVPKIPDGKSVTINRDRVGQIFTRLKTLIALLVYNRRKKRNVVYFGYNFGNFEM